MIIIRLVIFIALSLTLPFLYKGNFKLPPTFHAQLPFNPNWEVPPPTDEVRDILKSPFYYFAKGNQSTVFISEDGSYVLKLFRYRRTLFPIIHRLKNCFKDTPKLSFKDKIEKTFNATHLATLEGREFTQAIYCHLNLTENFLPNTILHVQRKNYPIKLDKSRFCLQKTAMPFKETLFEAKDDPEKMEKLIRSFVSLLIKRSEKNIRNSDPNLGPNFGFLNERAVEIDFGNYQKVKKNPKKQKEEICRFLISLEEWLAKNAPNYLELAIELRRKIEIAYDQDNVATQSLYESGPTLD